VLAVPAHAAAALLREPVPAAAAGLDAIRYVSTGTISLGFRADDIRHPLNGFGIVIPRSEKRAINAITWTSTKFDRRAPDGAVLLRCFFGGSRRPDMMQLDDSALEATVRGEIAELLGIDAPPLFHRIYRWMDANPQYDVGHLERITAIEAALPRGLHVTGSPYRGVGIPDCIHQAQETVAALAAGLVTSPAAGTSHGTSAPGT
jgi:oxygen-dependent protoporphyrinogen oxidase